MPRKGENICKRKDGRWEGRYIKSRTPAGKANYGYVYTEQIERLYFIGLQDGEGLAFLNKINHLDDNVDTTN